MDDPKGSVNDSKGDTPNKNYNDETQVEENKENIINNTLPFKYLEKDNAPEKIILDGEEKTNIFEAEKGKYDYIICILLKDDLNKSSEMLENTLKSIYALLRNKKINGEKWYLTIKNSWDKDVEFCVTMGGKLIPYSDSLITVFWHYGDMEVGLQSVVKKWVPDWTLNVINNQGP